MVVTMHRPVLNGASDTLAEEVSEARVRRGAAETARKPLFKACQSTLVSAHSVSFETAQATFRGGWTMVDVHIPEAPVPLRVFVSYSGTTSRRVAEHLVAFIENVLSASPWIEIAAGDRWLSTLTERLQEAVFGILVLTAENLTAPWVHFGGWRPFPGCYHSSGPVPVRHSTEGRERSSQPVPDSGLR